MQTVMAESQPLSASLCANRPPQLPWIRELPAGALEPGHRGGRWQEAAAQRWDRNLPPSGRIPRFNTAVETPSAPRAPPSRSRPVHPSRARGLDPARLPRTPGRSRMGPGSLLPASQSVARRYGPRRPGLPPPQAAEPSAAKAARCRGTAAARQHGLPCTDRAPGRSGVPRRWTVGRGRGGTG